MIKDASRPVVTAASIMAHSPLFAIIDHLIDGVMALETWRRRYKASMQGARVDSRILRDLGISEAQYFIEVNKPFWEK